MRIAILGAGMQGLQTARELSEEGKDVILVERDPDIARAANNELDCSVIHGDGEDIRILEKEGIADADWFIALAGNDEANIISCGLITELSKSIRTMARVRSDAFTRSSVRNGRFLGVDHFLNPDATTATPILRFAQGSMDSSVIGLREPGVQLRKFLAHRDSRFPGHRMADIRTRIGASILVPAVARKGTISVPDGSWLFDIDDLVYVLGPHQELDKVFGSTTSSLRRPESIVIFGATALANQVIAGFGMREVGDERGDSRKLNILVIEEDRNKAKKLAAKYPELEVVCRDFSDEFILEHERIDSFDLALCLTTSPSLNLALAQLVREAGTKRSLATVQNDAFMKLEGRIRVDALINQKAAFSGAVLDLIRRASIKRLHSFAEGELELIEIPIGLNHPAAGKAVQDLGLPRQILVAFVIHNGKTTVPNGKTIIHGGDRLGIVLSKSRIERMETIFGGTA